MSVGAPDVGDKAYFLLPRQCSACAGNNLVEISGPVARALRRRRNQQREVTQKIYVLGSRG